MTGSQQSAAQILKDAEDVLALAESGLAAVRVRDPARRMAGLWNVGLFGPAVPPAVERLQAVAPDFTAWFAPQQAALDANPDVRRFAAFRERVSKIEASSSRFVGWFGGRGGRMLPSRKKDLGPKPPNATRFFLGDGRGGAGWEIRLPDGTEQKYYVELPELLTVTLFEGERVGPRSIPQLCADYVDVLRRLVHDAREQFETP
jgi:hypothetical protein